jgi:transposase
LKVLAHDGVGIWLAAWRIHTGKFARPKDVTGTRTLTREQLDALVLGPPWQRMGGRPCCCARLPIDHSTVLAGAT